MSEITVQFRNKLNGYDKAEVDQFVRDAEAKLQEKALALATLQQQVVELEARLNKITGSDESVEEKLELYDKLMKKMDGDYNNLLAPAVAKAKAIEEKAQKEYEIRMDQARCTAEGIYAEAADRIAEVVDANMDRLYGLLDQFIYSKTLVGRVQAFIKDCKLLTSKVGTVASSAKTLPTRIKLGVKSTCSAAKAKVRAVVDSYKEAIAEADAEAETAVEAEAEEK